MVHNNEERKTVMLVLEGSSDQLQHLRQLYQTGKLEEVFQVPVLDLANLKPKIHLEQWFEGLFEEGWQQLNELLTPQQLSPVWGEELERAKEINLQTDLISHSVILRVCLDKESEELIGVRIRVSPAGEKQYLPPSLQLQVLVDDEVFSSAIARSDDLYIQCQFDAESGDEFATKLVLGNAEVDEFFEV